MKTLTWITMIVSFSCVLVFIILFFISLFQQKYIAAFAMLVFSMWEIVIGMINYWKYKS